LNFEPAFKASCFGHANKEFQFSCQVRFDFIAKSEGFSDSVLLKLLFLWFNKRLQIHSGNMDMQVGDPTVVEIRVSWDCHLLSAKWWCVFICALLRCFACTGEKLKWNEAYSHKWVGAQEWVFG
jgi:hypothetical protein